MTDCIENGKIVRRGATSAPDVQVSIPLQCKQSKSVRIILATGFGDKVPNHVLHWLLPSHELIEQSSALSWKGVCP